MARKAIYLMLTKSGPTQDEQLALIRRTIPEAKSDEIYVDDMTLRYRRKERKFDQRTYAIRALRKGDVLVVSSPGRLGIGREDIREVLHELARKGNAVIDAGNGREIRWSEEVADCVAFLDRATLEHRQGAAAVARKARALLGNTYKPQPKIMRISDAEARQMWHDRIRFPSQQEVSERCGVSTRTLYNRFGQRSPEPDLKRKPRSDRKN